MSKTIEWPEEHPTDAQVQEDLEDLEDLVQPTSRKLTQEEVDGFHRADFVNRVMQYVREEGVGDDGIPFTRTQEAVFLVRKNHFNLVKVKSVTAGEWNFSVAGQHFYSYRMSDVIKFLEDLYDTGYEILPLHDEIQIHATHLTVEEGEK